MGNNAQGATHCLVSTFTSAATLEAYSKVRQGRGGAMASDRR